MPTYDYYSYLHDKHKNKRQNIQINNIMETSLFKYLNKMDKDKYGHLKKVSNEIKSLKFKNKNIFASREINTKKLNHLGLLYYEIPFKIEYFFSKDDKMFHPDYNLVTKEWVTGQPIIKSTSWKGIFRNAFYELYSNNNEKNGLEKEVFGFTEEKNSKTGSLFFYTSIINGKIEKRIQTKVNYNKKATPIIFEIIEGNGVFNLLLCKHLMKEYNHDDVRIIIMELLNKIQELGVGAKRRINWGRIKFDFNNLKINGEKQ